MCNTSECITETLCVEKNGNSDWMLHSTIKKFSPSNANTEISKNINGEQHPKKTSSFKQVCEFPITVCRRGSKDILSWLNGLSISKKRSPSEIIRDCYNQIKSSLFLILMCAVLITISIEACICLFLLISVSSEPGFLFLFSTFVGVGFIGLRILTTKQAKKPKRKIKSKEI
ncbi:uncharacterized protein LOC135835911 [Planococcus citri]|uniref:uncharacterized protein LOC135835911 n=1 Tax=Planococcus citri TaxID=170843 RepID=UPI0031F84DF3